MPCDGKNANCERRRELLSQLKCLVSSMDRKKPCEWDEPPCPPPNCCPVSQNTNGPPCCSPVKACKSFELRGSIMYRCECIMRNGLQDRCMLYDCMGRPECMTKLYPVCGPGRAALLKLTDLGDAEVALKKFYCADQARENALAAYCRLTCGASACGPPDPPPCPSPPCCSATSSPSPCFQSSNNYQPFDQPSSNYQHPPRMMSNFSAPCRSPASYQAPSPSPYSETSCCPQQKSFSSSYSAPPCISFCPPPPCCVPCPPSAPRMPCPPPCPPPPPPPRPPPCMQFCPQLCCPTPC